MTSNLESVLNSYPTLFRAPTQLLSRWSPSQSIITVGIPQLLEISHALTRGMSQRIGQKTFEFPLPSRQRHPLEISTNANPSINVGNLTIKSPSYQI
jgi:hypothetical protein